MKAPKRSRLLIVAALALLGVVTPAGITTAQAEPAVAVQAAPAPDGINRSLD